MWGLLWGVVDRWRSRSVGAVVGEVWSEDGTILQVKICGRWFE